jgi:heat shock protein HtpX
MSALFLGIGYSLGGRGGMMTALVMSLVMNLGAYWFSDKLVLAMHRAQPVGPGDSTGVHEIIEELCAKANLPMPKVYVVPDPAPNAFATGRDPQHSAVAVTEGILRILSPRELRGVLAHEISHIGNRDILVSTIVASLASAIMYLAHMLQWFGMMGGARDDRGRGGIHPLAMIVTVLLAPLAASLVRAAVSRTREFMADESGAHVSEDPEALASALEKISDPALIQRLRGHSQEQPEFSHLYIVNHFSGGSMLNLFSTHPPVQERVRRLHEMRGSRA